MTKLGKLLQSTQTVFSTQDLRLLWGEQSENNLKQAIKYYTNTGDLIRLRRGIYIIKDTEPDVLELGNKLRSPSYISFETVLLQQGAIFQWGKAVSLAADDSREIQVGENRFELRKLKSDILLNKRGIHLQDNYSIASLERAFLDMLYVDKNFYFDNLRKIDFDICRGLLDVYQVKALEKSLIKWEKHVRSL